MMGLLTAIARKLAPDMARRADRYDYLIGKISEGRWWLSEFPDATESHQRLLELDSDHWRPLGEPARGKMPWGIGAFRERLRRRSLSIRDDGREG